MKSVTFTLAIATICTGLIGCSSNPGVAPLGEDQFIISRQAATGFSGQGALKIDALREAGAHCEAMGKAMTVNTTVDAKPPYILGNFPRTEITFTCS